MRHFESSVENSVKAGVENRAWEELIRIYDPLVRGRVHRLLRDFNIRPEPEAVEERAQEVYCRLLAGGPRRLRLLRRWSEGQVVSYLSRVARGVVADEARARSAVKRGGGGRAAGHLCEIARRAVDPRGTPEDDALLREGRRVVLARCRSLLDPNLGQEDRRRSLRILRRALLDGWTGEEIRRAEGGRLAASTIHSLVHRVRRRLVARYHPTP
jgi:DNA-directed RNA polymerase specialized sigma24 family protein